LVLRMVAVKAVRMVALMVDLTALHWAEYWAELLAALKDARKVDVKAVPKAGQWADQKVAMTAAHSVA